MKLIEYRFSPEFSEVGIDIGKDLADFFHSIGDIELVVVKSSSDAPHGVIRSYIHTSQMEAIFTKSFRSSFDEDGQYEDRCTVRSANSCRFVVFEDDGLVRICYSNDDCVLNFGDSPGVGEDVSRMLIETDMFDFI